jgi:hypothetical protein
MNDSQGKFPPIVFNEVDAVFNKANQLIKVTQPNVAIIHQGGVNYPKINAGDQSKFSGNSQTENKAN